MAVISKDAKPSTKGIVTIKHLKRLHELQINKEVVLSRSNKVAESVIFSKKDQTEKKKFAIGCSSFKFK